jgi:hypothetical protein
MHKLGVLILGLAVGLIASDEKTPVAEFEGRVAAYMKVHADALTEVTRAPSGAATDKGKVLAEAIRSRRQNAARGDIFTERIATEFRRLIKDSFRHNPQSIRASIKSGEQVDPPVRINDPYPSGVPVQTMPPSLLAALPKLPEPLSYRLAGSTLLLLDAGDKLIVDYLPHALPAK